MFTKSVIASTALVLSKGTLSVSAQEATEAPITATSFYVTPDNAAEVTQDGDATEDDQAANSYGADTSPDQNKNAETKCTYGSGANPDANGYVATPPTAGDAAGSTPETATSFVKPANETATSNQADAYNEYDNRRLGYTNEPTSAPTSADLTGDAYTPGVTGGEVIEPTSEPTSAPTDDPCDLSDSDVAGTPDSDTPETDITDTFLLTPGDAASEESEESSASTLSACAMTMTAVVVSLFL